MLPQASCADRVKPRSCHPLSIPEILLLSCLLTFSLPLALLQFDLDEAFSVFCLLFAVLGLWFEVSRPMASTPSPQLCSTRHQHFGRGKRTDDSMISLQVSTQPRSACWTAVVSLTDSCSTDIPHISGPMLDAYQRDRQVTKWLIKAVKRQENEVASFPVRSLRLLAGNCMLPLS